METPSAEPSSYSTFDTLCGLVFSLAVIMLVVGGLLLLRAFVTTANAAQTGTSDHDRLESTALAASLVSYGITCFTSGIPLLVISYGGWIFLDLARSSRLQIQKSEAIIAHLAEINPKHQERLERQKEESQRRVEAEQERRAAFLKLQAESEGLARERLAEEQRQGDLALEEVREQEHERLQRSQEARIEAQKEFDQILAHARKAHRLFDPAETEQLTEAICADIDKLFARLADLDQRFQINLTKEIGDQFAHHQAFKNLNINLEPA